MLRNEVLQCYFLIKRLLKRHRDHLELHAIRSRMLPDGALKDDYVIRVSRCLTRPKIDINEGFPFMLSFFYTDALASCQVINKLLFDGSRLITLASAKGG